MGGDAEGAEEDRQADPDHHGIGAPPSAREPREQVALERSGRDAGAAERVEPDSTRAPPFAGGAEPERRRSATERLQLERRRIPAIHDIARRVDPHRRHGRIPGPARMPERRGGARQRPGGPEGGEPENQNARAREPQEANRARERRGGRRPAPCDILGLGAVGQGEQRVAGAGRRAVEQRRERPPAPRAQLFQTPRHASSREPAVRSPSDDRGDEECHDRGGPGRQHPIRRLDPSQANQPRGRTEQQGARAQCDRRPAERGARPQGARDSSEGVVGRGARHPPYPTA